jgi:glycopeptide antibiotics resistance protein
MAFMRNDILALPTKWHLTSLCAIYAVVMLYSSTLVGPTGPNFVYRDPVQAFHAFLATPYVAHGSDQRADWIGNLLMLVPFGFMVAGAMWPRRPALRLPSAFAATLLCIVTILAIKYLQLFFPPRTVTLNYILAQSFGAVIGCTACAVWHRRTSHFNNRRDLVGALVLALRLYTGALCLFILMPLDFALNATDLSAQFDRLPDTLLTLPGHDRPAAIRAVVIVMAAVAFIPVGMMLTFVRKGIYQVSRGLLSVTGLGLLLTTGLYALSTLVISAFPVASSILYRTAGVVVGAAALSWLVRQDADVLRQHLGRLVPWAVLPYLASVLLVNQLLSTHWRSWQEAVDQSYPLGILPLFDYYIVTKGEAAKNIVGHAALYMPVGVMLWLRYGDAAGGRAFLTAAILSLAVELGRYLRPGLEGDINAIVVAGLSAWLAMRLMPAVWSMVRALGGQPAAVTKRIWDVSHRTPAAEPRPAQAGEVEHY